jgi:hypothetical protein
MKMKIMLLLLCSFVLLFTACNKNKYTTEPQVKFKSISPDVVSRGNVITFTSTFYDDEGDIDLIYIVQKWYNGSTATFIDTLKNLSYASTTAPANARTGEISMVAEYQTQNTGNKVFPWSPINRDTVATLGLLVIDKAGHRSNYTESDKFVLKKP